MMKILENHSWKTTLGGIITAAGISMAKSEDHNVQIIGQILQFIGPLILGASARDNNKSSEQVGAK